MNKLATFVEDSKMLNIKLENSKLCKYCGHRITFYAFEKNKKICSHCGRFNYKNDLIEFKEKMKGLIK